MVASSPENTGLGDEGVVTMQNKKCAVLNVRIVVMRPAIQAGIQVMRTR